MNFLFWLNSALQAKKCAARGYREEPATSAPVGSGSALAACFAPREKCHVRPNVTFSPPKYIIVPVPIFLCCMDGEIYSSQISKYK